ncbi:nicotinamide riboside transporter PnuC [Mycolicibacterium sp. Dal123E01]|uniref:nicotinamide riboside transporter PnuC n=1 Tax=Mycolicibacterium sp. Dal123E01 TaxID=3457578 RepID=UPI00403EECF4
MLGSLVAPLNSVIFVLGNDHVTWAELLGFVTGGLCVYLTVRGHVANFGVGIANSAFFFVLFLAAALWADAGLQVLYIALGFIGWWQWLRGGTSRSRRVIQWAGRHEIAWCIAAVVLATAGLYLLLRSLNDSAPFLDALTTALSLAAQWLLNTKRIETWWFWIAADIIYIPLYAWKGLLLTAIVYVLFLALCVAGLRAWRAAYTGTAHAPIGEPAAEAR